MDNLDELKAIWQTARTDGLPSSEEMVQMTKNFRTQKLRSKWLVIICSCLLSLLIMAVLFTVQFDLISTYIGGALMAFSGFLLAFTNIKSLKRFYQLDDCSNLDFVAFIAQTRQNQIYYYKKTMVVNLILYSTGGVLYLFEPTYQHPVWFICTYILIVVYLSIMWFVVRPRSIKKDAEKLDATLKRLEKITQQLK